MILPTYLQGEAGAGIRAGLKAYKALGSCPKTEYTLGSYRELLDGCEARLLCLKRLDGNLPVGFGVLEKI